MPDFEQTATLRPRSAVLLLVGRLMSTGLSGSQSVV